MQLLVPLRPSKTGRLAKAARLPVMLYRNAEVRPADVFLASYPKSGNTWLRMMVAGLISDDGCDSFDALSTALPELERLRQRRDSYRLPTGGRIVKTHESFHRRYRRGVHVVRDCRDVLLSYWKHQRRNGSFSGELEEYSRRFLDGRVDNYRTWGRNVGSWLDAAERHPDRYLIVQYEKLLSEPEETLAAVADFLTIPTTPSRIRTAVADNSRGRMSEKEKASTTIRSGGDRRLSFVSTEAETARPVLPEALETRLLDEFGQTMRRAGYPV